MLGVLPEPQVRSRASLLFVSWLRSGKVGEEPRLGEKALQALLDALLRHPLQGTGQISPFIYSSLRSLLLLGRMKNWKERSNSSNVAIKAF